jgi:hypothetical protein
MTSVIQILGIAFGFFYFFPVSLLELEPVYKCRNFGQFEDCPLEENLTWCTCTASDWCDNVSYTKDDYFVDWENPQSLHNWVE